MLLSGTNTGLRGKRTAFSELKNTHMTDFRYVVSGIDMNDREDFKRAVCEALPEGDKAIPAIAEKWSEEGIQKGLQQANNIRMRT